jgi:hypothetical protein
MHADDLTERLRIWLAGPRAAPAREAITESPTLEGAAASLRTWAEAAAVLVGVELEALDGVNWHDLAAELLVPAGD